MKAARKGDEGAALQEVEGAAGGAGRGRSRSGVFSMLSQAEIQDLREVTMVMG